ncbi:hypothetical protein FBU59_000005 [Linderina macrospora]|uniref:Uncharacterized protein n=1 Tax=Linderina macrospora TaxID=4868 RepID=A0ACC1JHV6_9FUNG|nr:hypothetical protein FBU59_000005 [Linderina macrospora]
MSRSHMPHPTRSLYQLPEASRSTECLATVAEEADDEESDATENTEDTEDRCIALNAYLQQAFRDTIDHEHIIYDERYETEVYETDDTGTSTAEDSDNCYDDGNSQKMAAAKVPERPTSELHTMDICRDILRNRMDYVGDEDDCKYWPLVQRLISYAEDTCIPTRRSLASILPKLFHSKPSDSPADIAMFWVKRLARQQDYPPALYTIGCWYTDGWLCVKPNVKLATQYLCRAATLEHAPATLKLASLFESQDEVIKSRLFYMRAAQLLDPVAMIRLAVAYLEGELGVVPNSRMAIKYLKEATDHATADCPYGAYLLARVHLGESLGDLPLDRYVPYSPHAARKLLRKAASLGCRPAMRRLSGLYETGEHETKVDYSKALELFCDSRQMPAPQCCCNATLCAIQRAADDLEGRMYK